MTKESFKREKLYLATMHMARKMLLDGIITGEEYRKLDAVFQGKYQPVVGTLFSDIDLL